MYLNYNINNSQKKIGNYSVKQDIFSPQNFTLAWNFVLAFARSYLGASNYVRIRKSRDFALLLHSFLRTFCTFCSSRLLPFEWKSQRLTLFYVFNLPREKSSLSRGCQRH